MGSAARNALAYPGRVPVEMDAGAFTRWAAGLTAGLGAAEAPADASDAGGASGAHGGGRAGFTDRARARGRTGHGTGGIDDLAFSPGLRRARSRVQRVTRPNREAEVDCVLVARAKRDEQLPDAALAGIARRPITTAALLSTCPGDTQQAAVTLGGRFAALAAFGSSRGLTSGDDGCRSGWILRAAAFARFASRLCLVVADPRRAARRAIWWSWDTAAAAENHSAALLHAGVFGLHDPVRGVGGAACAEQRQREGERNEGRTGALASARQHDLNWPRPR